MKTKIGSDKPDVHGDKWLYLYLFIYHICRHVLLYLLTKTTTHDKYGVYSCAVEDMMILDTI